MFYTPAKYGNVALALRFSVNSSTKMSKGVWSWLFLRWFPPSQNVSGYRDVECWGQGWDVDPFTLTLYIRYQKIRPGPGPGLITVKSLAGLRRNRESKKQRRWDLRPGACAASDILTPRCCWYISYNLVFILCAFLIKYWTCPVVS